MGQDKDREVAYQLLLQAKQTSPGENDLNIVAVKIGLVSEKQG